MKMLSIFWLFSNSDFSIMESVATIGKNALRCLSATWLKQEIWKYL